MYFRTLKAIPVLSDSNEVLLFGLFSISTELSKPINSPRVIDERTKTTNPTNRK